ncbi:Wadjet anti-phage system protein JetA family protein [Zhaonella formicivorans]|uniref:Wadjet anti-phage system protein JetA family protein n=1 Tax=Zhaonella formicivorans TaxID=2528593 RepID=UPI0010DDEB9E|nr:Wadjet anti-phage system protein JetA family protein [Zhaonella formicivorans]
MELFAIIPERLFSLLASPLKEDYAAILFRIYDQYQMTSFGMEREVILDIIQDYLETRGAQPNFLESLEEELAGGDGDSSLRSKAGTLLRKLEQTGWVKIEIWANYKQYINLPDYASKILDTLDKIRQNKQVEYQSYIYAAYTAVTSDEALRQPHLALERAFEVTQELVNHLKALNHNIKRYMERMLAQDRAADILRQHFHEYKLEVLDKAYHRLKTADNVSRYRPKIISKINEWLNDPLWVEEVVRQEVRMERQPNEEEARVETYRKLETIIQVYSGMDELLEEIDRRNSQYASASLRQVEYLLSSGKNTEGQLLEILKFLAACQREREFDSQNMEDVNNVFNLFSQGFLDINSLAVPRSPAREHAGGELQEPEEDPEVKEERLKSYLERMAKRITKEKVNAWILERMGNRQEIMAKELSIASIEDYIYLIYTAIFANSKKVQYKIDQWSKEQVFSHGFAYRDFRIKRKGLKVL